MIRDFPKGITNPPKIKFNYILLDFSNNNVVDNKNEQFCRISCLFQGNFVD